MIADNTKVECTDRESPFFGKQGVFIGYLANGMKIKFVDGKEGLFLPSSLKKI